MRSTFRPWCLLGWSLSQCWSACPTWAMPTDLNSVGRMEFSCQAQSFLCSFCSFLVIFSSPTSITHTSVFFSLRLWWSLVVTLKNSCSVHYQLAIPAEKEFTNFRLHGQFSPFVDRQAWLQFCRSSWNASHPGTVRRGILCDSLKAGLNWRLQCFSILWHFLSSDQMMVVRCLQLGD